MVSKGSPPVARRERRALPRNQRGARHAALPAQGLHATTPHIAASNEGLIVGRPVRHPILRLIPGMNFRLHPRSVAPAEGPEKGGPRRPTRRRSSCNNASNKGLIVGRPVRNAVLRLIRGMDLRLHPCSVAPAETRRAGKPPHPQKVFHATTPRTADTISGWLHR